ncbi:MAG: hypothetical protein DRJ49_00170 [Thermoprotei archaeon]|nr:MAG: hypothetical protein DRJ49_00170 [Thermoprotei archaeon]
MSYEPNWMKKRRDLARSLINRLPEPKYGVHIDLDEFLYEAKKWYRVETIDDLPPEVREVLNRMGLFSRNSAIQVDGDIVYNELRKNIPDGVIVENIEAAIRKYPYIENYWFKTVPLSLNKLTAINAAYSRGGFFIHVGEKVRLKTPIQACFLVASSKYAQLPHNILIAEPHSEVHILTGCTALTFTAFSLHAGLTEIFVKEGARVIYTMIHMWPPGVHIRPLKGVVVENGGEFISNYVLLRGGASLQAFPTVILRGRAATTSTRSIVIGTDSTDIDLGKAVYLLGEKSSARLISRAVAMGKSNIKIRLKALGKAHNVKAHLECDGIIVSDEASIKAIPELIGHSKNAELHHEASIGKVAEEQLLYLMSRGFEPEEATALIVRGFLDPSGMGLPKPLERQVRAMVKMFVEKAL